MFKLVTTLVVFFLLPYSLFAQTQFTDELEKDAYFYALTSENLLSDKVNLDDRIVEFSYIQDEAVDPGGDVISPQVLRTGEDTYRIYPADTFLSRDDGYYIVEYATTKIDKMKLNISLIFVTRG